MAGKRNEAKEVKTSGINLVFPPTPAGVAPRILTPKSPTDSQVSPTSREANVNSIFKTPKSTSITPKWTS